MSAPRLRWRRQPHETGLARVVEKERGYDLYLGADNVGMARPRLSWPSLRLEGYHWSAYEKAGIAGRSSLYTDSLFTSIDGAKSACEAYVRQCLGMPQKKERKS